jgi:hypothetical protein
MTREPPPPGRQYRHIRLIRAAAAAVLLACMGGAAGVAAAQGPAFFTFRPAVPAAADDALAGQPGGSQPLFMTAPDGLVLKAADLPGSDAWAGIALTAGGRWGLVAAGPGYGSVLVRAELLWARNQEVFWSRCYLVPLRKGLTGGPLDQM